MIWLKVLITISALINLALVWMIMTFHREKRRLQDLLIKERMIANQAIYIKEKDKAKELTGEELSNHLASERDRLAAVLSPLDREGNAGTDHGGSPD